MREAPLKLQEIFLDQHLRIILESLLLSQETPYKVFFDLFRLSEDEVETYKHFFFCLPEETSRMAIYSFLTRISDQYTDNLGAERANLFSSVFYDGWEAIDHMFNRGHNLDIGNFGKTMFKDMIMYLKKKTSNMIATDDLQGLDKVLSLVKKGTQLYTDNTDEASNVQLQLQFVEDLKNSGSQALEPLRIDGAKPLKFGTVDSSVNMELHAQITEDLKKKEKEKK